MRTWIVPALSGLTIGGLVLAIGLTAAEARDPAPMTVRDLRCSWSWDTHTVRMTATVINETAEVQDYAYGVEYLSKAGTRVGSGSLIVNRVAPGRTALVDGVGDFRPGTVPERCVIGLDG